MTFFDRLRALIPGGRLPPDPLLRGTRLFERGRLDEAEAAFREALGMARTANEAAMARNKLAIVAIWRGERERAIDELIAAFESDPRSAAAITTTGNLLLEDGAIVQAIAHFEYAILIDDGYAPAYHNLGVALHRSGKRGEAVRMLRKATRLESRNSRR